MRATYTLQVVSKNGGKLFSNDIINQIQETQSFLRTIWRTTSEVNQKKDLTE